MHKFQSSFFPDVFLQQFYITRSWLWFLFSIKSGYTFFSCCMVSILLFLVLKSSYVRFYQRISYLNFICFLRAKFTPAFTFFVPLSLLFYLRVHLPSSLTAFWMFSTVVLCLCGRLILTYHLESEPDVSRWQLTCMTGRADIRAIPALSSKVSAAIGRFVENVKSPSR